MEITDESTCCNTFNFKVGRATVSLCYLPLLIFLFLGMSKRIHIFTASDVATHNSPSSCWISRAGKVYDVTQFLQDHPGGDDLILQHAGKDVEEVMKNKHEHEHSEAAYEMLQEYLIGRIGSDETTVSDGALSLPVAFWAVRWRILTFLLPFG